MCFQVHEHALRVTLSVGKPDVKGRLLHPQQRRPAWARKGGGAAEGEEGEREASSS